jgi:hypothetical protein
MCVYVICRNSGTIAVQQENLKLNAATKWFTNVSKPRSDSYSSEATMDVLSVFIRVALDFIGLYGTQSTIIRPSGK